MSIEKRKNSKKPYIARVYIGTKDGKVKHKNKSFVKKRDAEEFEEKYTNFKQNKVDKSISDKVLFSAVFDQYIEKISSTKKDNTIKSYKSNFNKWIEPHLGSFQIGNIEHLTVIQFFTTIRDEGASDYIVNYTQIVLNEIFKFATSPIKRYVMTNPIEGIVAPTLEYDPNKIKFWSKLQTKKFLDAALGSSEYLIFLIMLNTGVRTGEMAAVMKSTVDLEENLLNVEWQISNYVAKKNEQKFDKGMFALSPTKNKARRSIPLNKSAAAAFKVAIAKNEENGKHLLFSPKNISEERPLIIKRGPVCKTVSVHLLTTKTFGNAVKKYAELAGVPNIGPHGLRHTFAANFLMNGGDIYTLSRLLGHKNINSTQIYLHLTASYLKSAINIVEFGG